MHIWCVAKSTPHLHNIILLSKSCCEPQLFFWLKNKPWLGKIYVKNISKYKFYGRSQLVRLWVKYTVQSTHCALVSFKLKTPTKTTFIPFKLLCTPSRRERCKCTTSFTHISKKRQFLELDFFCNFCQKLSAENIKSVSVSKR